MGTVIGLSVALARTALPAGVISGDSMSVASVVLLGVAIPLALRTALRTASAGILRGFPEAAAVVLVAVLFAFPTSFQSQILGPQVLAVLALVVLPIAGWLFWSAVSQSPSVVALALVAAALPVMAWWTERDVPGGLTWSTWVIAGLGVVIIGWYGLRGSRNARTSPRDATSDDRVNS